MRNFILYAILLFLIMLSSDCQGSDWAGTDTKLQLVYTALHIVDWGQTLDLVEQNHIERNPILREHPSKGSVNLYMGSTLVIHYIISRKLSPIWRLLWQTVTIGIESCVVYKNNKLGLNINF